jgi:hypothetical protein
MDEITVAEPQGGAALQAEPGIEADKIEATRLLLRGPEKLANDFAAASAVV